MATKQAGSFPSDNTFNHSLLSTAAHDAAYWAITELEKHHPCKKQLPEFMLILLR
jgi:hypothetical protein